MSDTVTMSEYWGEIEALAKSITKEARDEDRDIEDVLHETIDGHQFVIYTYQARHVAFHTANEDAIFDIDDTLPSVSSMSELYSIVAYHAMCADVRDHSEYGAGSDDSEDDETEEEDDTHES